MTMRTFTFAAAGVAVLAAAVLAAAPASAASGPRARAAQSAPAAGAHLGRACAAAGHRGIVSCPVRRRLRAPSSGLTLAQAPRALRAAVAKTLGAGALQPAASRPLATLNDPPGLAGDNFGSAVAIAGNTAVVGAPDTNSYTGAAYVFTRSGPTWTLAASLNDGAAGGSFGSAVAIAGNTIVVGADSAPLSGAAPYTGEAFVFTGSGTTWTVEATLTPAGGAEDGEFGAAVAIDPSTLTIAVGAPGQFAPDGPFGAAYVFSGAGWTQQGQLPYTAGAYSEFGYSVAISEGTIAVGAWGIDANAENVDAGAVFMFTGSGATWTLATSQPDPGQTGGDQFGDSVALQSDVLVAGANGTAAGGTVYVFNGFGASWTLEDALANPAGAASGLEFGLSVALSSNASTFAASDTNGATSGAAYVDVFEGSGASWTQTAQYTDPNGQRYDAFGGSTAISPPYVMAGAPGVNASAGVAYVFDLDTVTVTNPGKQSGTVGKKVSLQIKGSSSENYTLTWVAHLPPGLHIKKNSGLIYGDPSKKGTFSTKVTASDSTGASTSVSFTWKISA